MVKKMRKIQLIIAFIFLSILAVGLKITGPVKQKRPEFRDVLPGFVLAFTVFFLILVIFFIFPIRYYDSYINEIIIKNSLKLYDLVKITNLDRDKFRINADMSIMVSVRYQKRTALILEKYDLAEERKAREKR